MSLVHKIVRALEKGDVATDDDDFQWTCAQIALFFTQYLLYSDEIGEKICIHVLDKKNGTGRPLARVHPTWTAMCMKALHNSGEKAMEMTKTFKGLQVVEISDTVDLYIALESVLYKNCSVCKETYFSDVNKNRCEASHVMRKKRDERTTLRIGDLTDFWNTLDETGRAKIAKTGESLLDKLSPEAIESLTPNCQRLVALVAGTLDIKGHQLAVALDEASEYTFLYRVVRPVQRALAICRKDFVAAMAHRITDALAKAQSEHAAAEILREEEEQQRRAAAAWDKAQNKALERMVWTAPRRKIVWADED